MRLSEKTLTKLYVFLCNATVASGVFWCLGNSLETSIFLSIIIVCFTWRALKKIDFFSSRKTLTAYILLYSSANTIHQLNSFFSGNQGVDFAMFSQSAYRFSRTGHLETSLVGTRFLPFLEHHFSAIWYLPGCLATVAGNPAILLICLQAFCIGSTLFLTVDLLRQLKIDTISVNAFLILLSLHPTLRTSFFWEVREDIYYLPLMVLWILSLQKKQYVRCAFLALSTIVFQEKLILMSSAMQTATAAFYWRNGGRSRLPLAFFGFTVLLGPLFFFLYDIHPELLHLSRSFKSGGRIESFSNIMTRAHLTKVLIYWWGLLSPSLAFGIFSIFGLGIALPALLLGVINCISNSSAMLDPYQYYSIIASVVLGVAASFVFVKLSLRNRALFIGLTLLGCSAQQVHNFPNLWRWNINDRNEIRLQVPIASTLIVDDYSAASFYDYSHLTRVSEANRVFARYDYVVVNPHANVKLADYILASSTVCFKNKNYTVRCKKRYQNN